jgi:EpsI family protein
MKLSVKSIVLLALMLLSAALGWAMRPRIYLSDERPPINLAAMVPTTFGDWHEEVNLVAQVVNPQQRDLLSKIYSQTLSRTYVNTQGYRVMLSVAYGKNQSDSLELHKPETCYPAQGFTLLSKTPTVLDFSIKPISATRLATQLGQRFEPITYWTVVGDYVTNGGTGKKFAELRYSLANRIPDGMLIRLSSIDKDTANAYEIQRRFSKVMIEAIAPDNRNRFGGAL